jgi:hypothetical protein
MSLLFPLPGIGYQNTEMSSGSGSPKPGEEKTLGDSVSHIKIKVTIFAQ